MKIAKNTFDQVYQNTDDEIFNELAQKKAKLDQEFIESAKAA